jgi:hypothetical protein
MTQTASINAILFMMVSSMVVAWRAYSERTRKPR